MRWRAEPARRVLLVEPDRALGRILERVLSRQHKVTVSTSAEAALRVLGGSPADVVVTAYRLHGATARQLLTHLRHGWPRPRVVVYAAEADLRAPVRALADAVVRLPGDFEDILRAVGG